MYFPGPISEKNKLSWEKKYDRQNQDNLQRL